MSRSIILNEQQIQNKIRRIAYQIYENNTTEKEVILAGIAENGYTFAVKLKLALEQIAPLNIKLCKVEMNKRKPLDPINTSLEAHEYKNKPLVLVDDVLNSGSTLIYAAKHFLDVPLKKFKTAVLVNRNHKKYPIKADFKGLSLSTSMQEHISVEFNKDGAVAYLN